MADDTREERERAVLAAALEWEAASSEHAAIMRAYDRPEFAAPQVDRWEREADARCRRASGALLEAAALYRLELERARE